MGDGYQKAELVLRPDLLMVRLLQQKPPPWPKLDQNSPMMSSPDLFGFTTYARIDPEFQAS